MTKGSAFLFKLGNGDDPLTYTTVGGFRAAKVGINGDVVALTAREPNAWRELLSGAGTRSVSVSATGIFLGSAAEARVRANALAGVIEPCELSFENGEKLRGRFLIQRLDYAGDYNGERNYSINLESSGPVVPA